MKKVYETRIPILMENFKVRLKAKGGICFVTENQQEVDNLELGKKARLGIDEAARDDQTAVVYDRIELKMIPISLPIDVITLTDNGGAGGMVMSGPIATAESSKKWEELLEYIKNALFMRMEIGRFEAYRNSLASDDQDLDIKVLPDRKEKIFLELVEERSNTDMKYHEQFVKMVDGTFNQESGAPVLLEKRISNYDYKGEIPDYLDIDLLFHIQIMGKAQLVILNT